MKKGLGAALFWGALWGMLEAIMGFLSASPSLFPESYLRFPIAWFFLWIAWSRTSRGETLLWTSFTAAAVITLDLLMPVSPSFVLHPAVASLMIGVVLFFAVEWLFPRLDRPVHWAGVVLLTNTLWRILFLGYLYCLPEHARVGTAAMDGNALVSFFVAENAGSSALIIAVQSALALWAHRKKKPDITG